MKRISVDELPRYSSWPARLLGNEAFVVQPKTVNQLIREYDREKYAVLHQYLRKHPKDGMLETISKTRANGKKGPVCFSEGADLYVGTTLQALARRKRCLTRHLKSFLKRGDTVIELGAGIGEMVALLQRVHPKAKYIAGELTSNGRALSKAFSKGRWDTVPFNFYDRRWEIFDETASNRIVVVTSHSLEMLPDASLFIDRLVPYADRIVAVLHIEPVYRPDDMTLLGMLRQRYIEVNHYNRDLQQVLSTDPRVRLDKFAPNVFGMNPLFPESILVWKFR